MKITRTLQTALAFVAMLASSALAQPGRLSPQGGVVVQVGATSGGGITIGGTLAKPTVGLQACPSGQFLTHNGTSWACAATFTTNNVIPKGNGTGMVASNIRDTGATISMITTNAGNAYAAGTWTVAGGFTVFGPNAGDTAFGAALGLGYSSTLDEAQIIAVAPSTGWKPLVIASDTVVWKHQSGTTRQFALSSAGAILTHDDGGSHANKPAVTITNSSAAGALNHRADLSFNVYDSGGVARNAIIQAEGQYLYIGSVAGLISTSPLTQVNGNLLVQTDTTLGDGSTRTTTINGIANLQNVRGKVQDYTSPTGSVTITLNADTTILRLNPTAATVNILGITGGADGRILIIENKGTQNSFIYDEHAGATAADRINAGMAGGFGYIVNGGSGSVLCRYDGVSTRWRCSWMIGTYAPSAFTAPGDLSSQGNVSALYRVNGGIIKIPTLAVSSLTSGTVNDWNPDGTGNWDLYAASIIDITAATGTVTITGFDATNAADGDQVTFFNRSGQLIQFSHDTGSITTSPKNRLFLLGGVTQELQPSSASSVDAISFTWKSGVGWIQRTHTQTNDRHVYYAGPVPTLSGCAACTISSVSTDARGKVSCTDGPQTCTVTFAAGYLTNAPICTMTGTPSGFVVRFTTAPSTTAFSFGTTTGTNDYFYACDGVL